MTNNNKLRELDILISEKLMGICLKPDRYDAMRIVGAKRVMETGPEFKLNDGTIVPMPTGQDLFERYDHKVRGNALYYVYIAEFLGDKVRDEIDSIRLDPKPYSTEISAAWEVVEKLRLSGTLILSTLLFDESIRAYGVQFQHLKVTADTAPLAICLAAQKYLEETDRIRKQGIKI